MNKRGLLTPTKTFRIFLSLVLFTLIFSVILTPFSLSYAQENGKNNETKEPQDSSHTVGFSLLELAVMNSMAYIIVIPNACFLGFSPAKLAVVGSYFYVVSTPQKARPPHPGSYAEPIKVLTAPTSESHYIICCSNQKNMALRYLLWITSV